MKSSFNGNYLLISHTNATYSSCFPLMMYIQCSFRVLPDRRLQVLPGYSRRRSAGRDAVRERTGRHGAHCRFPAHTGGLRM